MQVVPEVLRLEKAAALRTVWRRQPERLITTLESDPPWPFDGSRRRGGAGRHYNILSIADILAFPLVPLARDARLFLWRVGAMQDEALAVIKAWGFTLKSELVWIKTTLESAPLLIDEDGEVDQDGSVVSALLRAQGVKRLNNLHYGMGHQTRYAHETCLIATRGAPGRTAHVRSVFFAPVPRGDGKGKRPIHSCKPAKFYKIVEAMSPGPYHSMFSRVNRPGWTTEGDELVAEAS